MIAILTGSGASAVASRCREAGWQVAIVESRPFGGMCALRGCDPKKVLVGAAEAVDWTRRMIKRLLQTGDYAQNPSMSGMAMLQQPCNGHRPFVSCRSPSMAQDRIDSRLAPQLRLDNYFWPGSFTARDLWQLGSVSASGTGAEVFEPEVAPVALAI